jgi:hypothetical protein
LLKPPLLFHNIPAVSSTMTLGVALLVIVATHFVLKWLRRKLSAPPICIHFDVNETIMLGDPAGGDSYEDSLHKILAKVAFVRPVAPGSSARGAGRWADWTWHDGSPLDPLLRDPSAPPPPLLTEAFEDPPGCVRFYNVPELKRAFAKCFASKGSPGAIYAETLEGLRAQLRWPDGVPRDPVLCSEEGYHRFLPAFFETLVELRRRRWPYSVVVRTFGTDLPHLLAALDAFGRGRHPHHAGLRAPEFSIPPERTWRGRYDAKSGSFNLMRHDSKADEDAGSGASGASGDGFVGAFMSEAAMLAELEGPLDRGGGAGGRLSAIQDDYGWWKGAGYSPGAGKPLWLTQEPGGANRRFRHIFFDDNIHADPLDSIVAVRVRAKNAASGGGGGGDDDDAAFSAFRPVSGRATVALQGSVLRKVPTVRPVQQRGWFLEQIAKCEARCDELLARDARGEAGGFAAILSM